MAFHPFPQTRWTLLLSAKEGETEIATKALEELAEAYWKPVYAFLRRKGHGHEAAQDETQAFFQQLIKRDFLRNVHPEGGQFRNFLLVSLRHRLIDQHRRIANRQQRTEVPLEFSHDVENLSESSPEDAFDRAWAEALVTRAMAALEARWSKRSALFAELRSTVDGSGTVAKGASRNNLSKLAFRLVCLHDYARVRNICSLQEFGSLLYGKESSAVGCG